MKPKLLTPLQVGPTQTATVQHPGPACGCRDRTHLSPFVGDTLPVLDGSDDGGDGGCSTEMTGEASVRMGSRGHPVPAEAPPKHPTTHTGRPSSFALSTKKFPFFRWSCKEEDTM